MEKTNVLAPTLWRTCRALANPIRLRLLDELFKHSDQTVSGIAARLRLPMPLASKYLREINARGLISTRRSGRSVYYQPKADHTVRGAADLLQALECCFATERHPTKTIFRQVTAFTHPRRIAIAQALQSRAQTLASLRIKTGLSLRVLSRHLRKLKSRGFVEDVGRTKRLATLHSELQRTLLSLAFRS